jgi:branched-chain amino acid transport system permease protein
MLSSQMGNLAQIIVSGLAIGCVYALIALALVLVHKATDVINFAQGEMAMFSAFLAFVLHRQFDLPVWLILMLAIPIGGLIGAATERIAIRPLINTPPLNALIATIGLWMIFHYGAGWIWGFDPFRFPTLLTETPIEFAGARFAANSLGIAAVTLLLLGCLYVLFEFTREGIAMRAASMNVRAARLMGIRASRVSAWSWGIAGAIGMVAGVLVAPITFVDVDMMFQILIKAIAGAVLGGMTSLPGAVIGGICIGIIETLGGVYISSEFKEVFAFFVIVTVLMIRPEGLFGKPAIKKV